MQEGRVYRLRAYEGLSSRLERDLPELLWIPNSALDREPGSHDRRDAVLEGVPVDEGEGRVLLASRDPVGRVGLHFDSAATVDGIVLEHYRGSLKPTVEMRLPFNYSALPSWAVRLGLTLGLRRGALLSGEKVPFPSGDPCDAADWLQDLSAWCGATGSERTMGREWPEENSAALAITHDVDSDWLFRNPSWLERICDLEERHGLAGAWYCVPMRCRGRHASAGLQRLVARGCEIGCHGYNHDAKWPLLKGRAFEDRLDFVRRFRDRWQIRGFRSEWLWRTPEFLRRIGAEFDYDSSIPSSSPLFSDLTWNGCATCRPFLTHGELVELPLTLPMDDDRFIRDEPVEAFWDGQLRRAARILERGGLVVVSLHPQRGRAAEEHTLRCIDRTLGELCSIPRVWKARPDRIAEWARERLAPVSRQGSRARAVRPYSRSDSRVT